jgi:5'-3' exonuclease
MRLLLDGNSILNAAILGGKDDEYGHYVESEGKRVHVNSAQYGTDKFFDQIEELCKEFNVAPRDMVLVWDSPDAKKFRQTVLPTYKEGRSKIKEVAEQINIAREQCNGAMLALGAHIVSQSRMEADDTIAYLCQTLRGERNVVVTSDGDLTVLVDENTDVWRLGKLNENPYGPFPHKYITLYKALVGDTSDKIPGAKGFGDVAFCDLVRTWGIDGLAEVERLILNATNRTKFDEPGLEDLQENVSELKSLQKVIDSKEQVYASWKVAKLYPDKVNTLNDPIFVKAGMVQQWGVEGFQAQGLKRFYGTKTLVTAANYAAVRERLARVMGESPFVALDIETSSSVESDDWLENLKRMTESDRARIDVLGHELTGMSLTFGANTQHTIYMSVDHKDSDNITVDQCREMVELIPQSKHTIIQNRNFEFSVLYRTWGEKWKDNGWYGFVPNALDSKVGASYCNENLKKGLKERSKVHLGYEQATYEQTTTKSGPMGSLQGGEVTKTFDQIVAPAVFGPDTEQWIAGYTDPDTGEITDAYSTIVPGVLITPAVTEKWETRQYKMRELTALEVFDYGADDTLCTAALHTHYKFVMDLEHTWDTYLAVETLPEYLTSLAFVQGIPISIPTLRDLEAKDKASYEKAWATLREYLMTKGWDGTECPEVTGTLEAADVKALVPILLGAELVSKRRKLNALAMDIRAQFPDNELATSFAQAVEEERIEDINRLLKNNFTGEPAINFGSPKQMQHLFYTVIGIKPRIINKLTEKQRGDEVLAEAFRKLRKAKDGKYDLFEFVADPNEPHDMGDPKHRRKMSTYLTKEEYAAIISKSSTDDTAVDTALALDADTLTDEAKAVLKAYKTIKEVQTRQNLFYKTYKAIPHWRDGRIHPSLNQAEAVTRRYSSSGPNVQQLPKSGSVPFRQVLQPHKAGAVVVSLDYKSQELRLSAEATGDVAMTACFVGENLMDIHSLTAVSAAPLIWHEDVAYKDFLEMLESKDPVVKGRAKALRSQAKTTVFASAYGAMAGKIAETLFVSEEVAQAFLDAKDAAFPRVRKWDAEVTARAKETGYSVTMLGARRHLRDALLDENHWERSKAERQVGNFAIQGSGAEVNKLAMARMWERGLFAGKYDACFYAPIHDENVFSVSREHAFDVITEVHQCMTAQYANMKIPMESSISLGPNFGTQIEVGDHPDREVIEKAIAEALGEVS